MNDKFLKELWKEPSGEFEDNLWMYLAEKEKKSMFALPFAQNNPRILGNVMKYALSTTLGVMLTLLFIGQFVFNSADDPAEYSPLAQTEITSSPQPELVGKSNSLDLSHLYFVGQTSLSSAEPTVSMALSYFGFIYPSEVLGRYLSASSSDFIVHPWEITQFVNDPQARGETQNSSDFMHAGEVIAVRRVGGNYGLIQRLIDNDFPIMVEIGDNLPAPFLGASVDTSKHQWGIRYVLVVGYDEADETVLLYDSYRGFDNGIGYKMPFAEFDQVWRQSNRNFIIFFPFNETDETLEAVLAEHFEPAGAFEIALEQNQADVESESANIWIQINLVEALNGLERYEDALGVIDNFDRSEMPTTLLHYRMSILETYYQLDMSDEFYRVMYFGTNDKFILEDQWYYQGLYQTMLGNDEKAAEHFDRLLEYNPNYQWLIDNSLH